MKPLRGEDGAAVLKKSGRPVQVASGRRQKMQRRAATIRLDWSHQTACRIARQFQFIVLEDLNLKGMTKSAKGTRECPGKQVGAKSGLNRKLLRSCMGQLGRLLEYKAMPVLRCRRGTRAGSARGAGTRRRGTARRSTLHAAPAGIGTMRTAMPRETSWAWD
ncbi:MAG: hypothetical protein OXC38_04210 [Gammaproteobacteria bacterium]|nr:hypothetical protein [Gammaproteobacteria bacterium]